MYGCYALAQPPSFIIIAAMIFSLFRLSILLSSLSFSSFLFFSSFVLLFVSDSVFSILVVLHNPCAGIYGVSLVSLWRIVDLL